MENRRQDRRGHSGKKIIPRQFKRRERVFVYERKIYLSDTNAFQNVYFAQFFHYLGEAREELMGYLAKEKLSDVMQSGIVLLTRDCALRYKNSIYAYDDIVVEIGMTRLTAMSVKFSFTIQNLTRDAIAADGSMTIACSRDGKLCPLPDILHTKLDELFIKGIAQVA